ncbi:MAG: hypothetical protein J6F31_05550 [Oscillospiraceae bacterium]|nr:hypothetical protein [Oscillospiraceae bacterium]
MKILMINLPFAGHTNPTLPLTKALAERGHRVTYINAEPFRERIAAAGAEFVPYADFPLSPSENEKKRLSFRAAFDTAMSLDERFDILIYEMFFYPGAKAAERMGIPCVRQFSQPAWSEQTWSTAPRLFKLSSRLIDMQVLTGRDARRMGYERSCLKDGIISCRPDLNIVYVPKEFQSCLSSFDESYVFFVPPPAPSSCTVRIPYGKIEHPIVYISLGSIISDRGFCRKCISAFGNKPFSVILNTGKVDPSTLGSIPSNIFAYPFVPQVEVLSHADVFLTHCGMNSINEALYAGVPMVTMPFLNDQITNARRVCEMGLGKSVPSFPMSGKKMYEAVCTVYRDAGYREKAERMRSALQAQAGMAAVTERIEELVRRR